MIQIDTRAGSEKLIEPLRELGLPVEPSILEYGDVAWVGKGPGGRPVTVGIEHKTVADVLQCITNGRFAGHQLPGLQKYEVAYLMVEGRLTLDHEGCLMELSYGRYRRIPRGKTYWKYDALDNWLTTIEVKAGLRVRRTGDHAESIHAIAGMYGWWTRTDFEDHRSHLVTYLGSDLTDRVWTTQASQCARGLMAMVKGLGEQRARAIAAKYGSMRVVAETPAKELEKIEGMGKTLAARVAEAMWSEK